MTSTSHLFSIEDAAKYGIEAALLIHHFRYWVNYNARLKRNFHEGKYWTYQTFDEIAAHFPYMSKERIINEIERLCTGKSRFSKKKEKEFEPILQKGNFNKNKYDRTVWYAFLNDPIDILCSHNIDVGKTQDQECNDTTPIPDSKNTHTKTVIPPEGPPPSEPALEAFGSHVKLRRKDYDGFWMCESPTHQPPCSRECIDQLIQEMNDYVASTGKKYKCYAAALRTWLRRRKEGAQKPSSAKDSPQPSQDQQDENRAFAERIKSHCIEKGYREIEVGYHYLELRAGNYQLENIKFNEHGFKEKCLNWLRKRNIDIQGL